MIDLGCLGLIQSQFQLFWHDSRPILTISMASQYNPIRLIWLDSGQICLVRCESKLSQHESSRAGANPRKKKKGKKKSSDAALTSGHPRRTLHPVLGQVRLQCGTLPAMSVLHRFSDGREKFN